MPINTHCEPKALYNQWMNAKVYNASAKLDDTQRSWLSLLPRRL
jgi:uncharacterized damage-inducible protein DinB